MKRFSCAGAIVFAIASGAVAGEAEWSAHTKAAMAAYARGDQLDAARSFAAALNEAQGFAESDRRLASTISNLALLYANQGRHADAEALYARAVTLDEKALGPGHPDLAVTLNNIAGLYRAQGRYAEAEPLYRRSLAIMEKALGPNHTQTGTTLNNLAELYRAQGRNAEAEPLYRRAYAIREKAHGPNHPDVATTLGQLAELYRAEGLYAQAEPLSRRALQIEEQVFGPGHPDVATALARQGDLDRAMGKPADAEALYRRALAIRERALGADHLEVGRTLASLADLYFLQGRLAEAETSYARALRITEQALGQDHPEAGAILYRQAVVYNAQGKREPALASLRRASAVLSVRVAQGELRPWVGVFEDHVRLLVAMGDNAPAALAESFAVAQTARASTTVAQGAWLTARYAGGRDRLARYARARHDAIVRLRQLDTQLMQAVARPPRDRDPLVENRLRAEAAQARKDFLRLDAQPEGDPARQADLASPKPLDLRDAQRHLAPDEALAVLMVLRERSLLWVVRRDAAGLYPLALRQGDLAEMVKRLGSQLDARGASRPSDPSFDVALAHELYRRVFSPGDALLAGVKHLILVPDGALGSLPPGVLVSAPPAKPPAPLDYTQVEWLVKRHAVTVLPSVALLRSRDRAARPSAAREAFRGFGELPALAGALKVNPDTLMQGAMAAEASIKESNLTRFRALAFAAQGALVRRAADAAEPALVMTAPAAPRARDDGILTASEIAQLRLDADWVLLAGDVPSDEAAAEGRATLARSFIHAGARSVLVAYGGANAQSTAEITGRLAAESAAGATQAEALRRSMLAFMTAAGDPQRAHPRYWAGLTVVGEGNARWSEGPLPPPVAETARPTAEQRPESASAADAPPPAAAGNRDNPFAKALAAVTGMLSQIGKSGEAAPQAQPEPQAQLQPPAQPQPKPQAQAQPQPQPQPEPQAKPVPPKPASTPEVKPTIAAAPPPPQVQPQPQAEPINPKPASVPEVKPAIAAAPPPPPPAAEPPVVRAEPLPREPAPAAAEAPVPESAGVNPITAAIEGVGAMLTRIFGSRAEVESPSPAESAPAADSSAPVQNWSTAPEADASPSPAAEESDNPVARIIRDVGAALARLVAPPGGAEAPAESTAPPSESAQQVALAQPAPSAASAPDAAAEKPTESSPPATGADSGNPITAIVDEIGALLTRLQLALNLQKLFESQPMPESDAPREYLPQQGGAVLDGSPVLTMDGRPVLGTDGNPVLTAKVSPVPEAAADADSGADDNPVAAAFRTVGDFLRRLLGGESGTTPAQ